MPKHALEVLEFVPCERNTLRGFATVKIAELHLTIHGVAMAREGWQALGATAEQGAGSRRSTATSRRRNIKYVPIVEITDRETADAFSHQCWSALDACQKS